MRIFAGDASNLSQIFENGNFPFFFAHSDAFRTFTYKATIKIL